MMFCAGIGTTLNGDQSSPGSMFLDLNDVPSSPSRPPLSHSRPSSFLHPHHGTSSEHGFDMRSSKSTFEHYVDSSHAGHEQDGPPSGSGSPLGSVSGKKRGSKIRERVTSFVRRKSSGTHTQTRSHGNSPQHPAEPLPVAFPTAGAESGEDSTSAKSSHPHERNRVKSLIHKLTPSKAVSLSFVWCSAGY